MVKSSKPKLVALDNDLGSLLDIQRAVGAWYDVLQTQDARRALAFVDHCPAVRVIVSEHVLATTTGVTVLETARALRPDVRRVLLTVSPELATVAEGVRSGAVQRVVVKPFGARDLQAAVVPEAGATRAALARAGA